MTPHIPSDTARKLVRLIIGVFIVNLMVLSYVFYQSYKGREDLVTNNRAACEPAKRDRAANALGWRTAEIARLQTTAEQLDISFGRAKAMEQNKPPMVGPPDLVAARRYNKIAFRLERRSKIDCSKVFPKAGLLP